MYMRAKDRKEKADEQWIESQKQGQRNRREDWSCCLRRVGSRPVEEPVPELKRGGVWVETREVPMPPRPLGSSGGRCDVWGLKIPFVSGCYSPSVWPAVLLFMSVLVCWPSTGEGKPLIHHSAILLQKQIHWTHHSQLTETTFNTHAQVIQAYNPTISITFNCLKCHWYPLILTDFDSFN